MEAGDSGHKQRLVCSPKTKTLVGACADPNLTSYRERPTMATTLISPSAPYHHHHHQHQHHNSFSSGYPHSAPATSIPGMISLVEPRRVSDDSEPAHTHRQSLPSLPSISEVFSEKKVLGYTPPPASAPIPPA
jgi:hypothetical protein